MSDLAILLWGIFLLWLGREILEPDPWWAWAIATGGLLAMSWALMALRGGS